MSWIGTCVYCQTEMTDRYRAVVCARCGRPYHDDCWQENGSCSVYGCGSSRAEPMRRHFQSGPAREKSGSGRRRLDLGEGDVSFRPSPTRVNEPLRPPPRVHTPPPQSPPPHPAPAAGSGCFDGGDDPCNSICGCLIMVNALAFCTGAPLPLCMGC